MANADSYLSFHTALNNSVGEKLRITSSGNIGIGTTNPTQMLDVAGPAKIQGTLDMASNKISNLAEPVDTSDAATKAYVDTKVSGGQLRGSGDLGFIPKFSGTATINNSAIFESGGNIGIGITAPQAKLDIGPNIVRAAGITSPGQQMTFASTPPRFVPLVCGFVSNSFHFKFNAATTDRPNLSLDSVNCWGTTFQLNGSAADSIIKFGGSGGDIHHLSSMRDMVFNANVGATASHLAFSFRRTNFDDLSNYTDLVRIWGNGNLTAAGVKSFVQDHPEDATKEIIYASQEGPEAGVYVRGSAKLVNGVAMVTLPDHFTLVTSTFALITVQVTPMENCQGLYVEKKNLSKIVIKELNGGISNAQFDFLVQGIRKGYEDFTPIRSKTIR